MSQAFTISVCEHLSLLQVLFFPLLHICEGLLFVQLLPVNRDISTTARYERQIRNNGGVILEFCEHLIACMSFEL